MHRHAPRRTIHRQRSGGQPLPRTGLRAAQHRVDTRHQLLVVERPRDEVVATAREGVHSVDGVGPGLAEHDHRHVAIPRAPGLALPQHAAHLERRRIGQAAHEHEVGPLALHELQRFPARIGSQDREAVARQMPLQELPRPGLGLGEEQR